MRIHTRPVLNLLSVLMLSLSHTHTHTLKDNTVSFPRPRFWKMETGDPLRLCQDLWRSLPGFLREGLPVLSLLGCGLCYLCHCCLFLFFSLSVSDRRKCEKAQTFFTDRLWEWHIYGNLGVHKYVIFVCWVISKNVTLGCELWVLYFSSSTFTFYWHIRHKPKQFHFYARQLIKIGAFKTKIHCLLSNIHKDNKEFIVFNMGKIPLYNDRLVVTTDCLLFFWIR